VHYENTSSYPLPAINKNPGGSSILSAFFATLLGFGTMRHGFDANAPTTGSPLAEEMRK